jgi:hypothetical protein
MHAVLGPSTGPTPAPASPPDIPPTMRKIEHLCYSALIMGPSVWGTARVGAQAVHSTFFGVDCTCTPLRRTKSCQRNSYA